MLKEPLQEQQLPDMHDEWMKYVLGKEGFQIATGKEQNTHAEVILSQVHKLSELFTSPAITRQNADDFLQNEIASRKEAIFLSIMQSTAILQLPCSCEDVYQMLDLDSYIQRVIMDNFFAVMDRIMLFIATSDEFTMMYYKIWIGEYIPAVLSLLNFEAFGFTQQMWDNTIQAYIDQYTSQVTVIDQGKKIARKKVLQPDEKISEDQIRQQLEQLQDMAEKLLFEDGYSDFFEHVMEFIKKALVSIDSEELKLWIKQNLSNMLMGVYSGIDCSYTIQLAKGKLYIPQYFVEDRIPYLQKLINTFGLDLHIYQDPVIVSIQEHISDKELCAGIDVYIQEMSQLIEGDDSEEISKRTLMLRHFLRFMEDDLISPTLKAKLEELGAWLVKQDQYMISHSVTTYGRTLAISYRKDAPIVKFMMHMSDQEGVEKLRDRLIEQCEYMDDSFLNMDAKAIKDIEVALAKMYDTIYAQAEASSLWRWFYGIARFYIQKIDTHLEDLYFQYFIRFPEHIEMFSSIAVDALNRMSKNYHVKNIYDEVDIKERLEKVLHDEVFISKQIDIMCEIMGFVIDGEAEVDEGIVNFFVLFVQRIPNVPIYKAIALEKREKLESLLQQMNTLTILNNVYDITDSELFVALRRAMFRV